MHQDNLASNSTPMPSQANLAIRLFPCSFRDVIYSVAQRSS